jgi:type IV pilus assembly protein PilQ
MNRSIAFPSTLRGMLLLALVAMTGQAALAAESPANKLQSIDVQAGGKGLQLVLTTSGPAPDPVSYTIDNPARISLTLPSTGLALAQRRIDVRSGGLDSVLAAEATDGRSRLVLNLDRMLPYQTRVEGNRIYIMLGEGAAAGVAAAAPAAASTAAPPTRASRGIKSIDFRRASDGSATGRLIVKLDDPRIPVNLSQQGNRVIVDFVGADLPANLQGRRLDFSDFATPVTSVDVTRSGNGSQLAISASGDFEQLAYQADDQYVVEIQPRRQPRVQAEEKAVYTGEKMTVNFQDIATRTLLQLIGDTSGRNIVIDDSVTGAVTLRLTSVPWDHVLDIVLQTKGLGKRVRDNVIIVAPTAVLAAQEKAEASARKDEQDLAPLRQEYLQINYAKADDVAQLIAAQSGRSGGGGAGSERTFLSGRGRLTIDSRTNTLIISDTAESLNNIRQLVQVLDIPGKQVQIEARIVVVSQDFSRDLGVRSGFTGTETNGANGLFATTGSAAGADTILGSALTNAAGGGGPLSAPLTAPTGPGRYNVNLPVAGPAGSLALMVLGADYIVDLELSAAQREGKGEVISSPHVIATNQQEAMISQGTEIPYQEAASSGAATISFKKAVLELRVTPLITPDNRLQLELSVKKGNVGKVVVTTGGVNVPSIDTSELTTSVFLADGQTAVLGGILETEQRDTVTKVPLLGDIPFLGHLFKSTSKVNNRGELLIFVTPKIIREGVAK